MATVTAKPKTKRWRQGRPQLSLVMPETGKEIGGFTRKRSSDSGYFDDALEALSPEETHAHWMQARFSE